MRSFYTKNLTACLGNQFDTLISIRNSSFQGSDGASILNSLYILFPCTVTFPPFSANASLALIMYQYTTSTNIVSMEILNLEVEDRNRFRQLLTADSINESIIAVLELQLVTQLQILRGDPALALHIEGMLGGTGNGFAIDLNMYQFILLIQEGAGTVNLYAQIILQAAEKRVVRQ